MGQNKLTPLKAIRAACLECMCWNAKEVKLCERLECPLLVYRFGKNPSRKGIGGGKLTQRDENRALSVEIKGN